MIPYIWHPGTDKTIGTEITDWENLGGWGEWSVYTRVVLMVPWLWFVKLLELYTVCANHTPNASNKRKTFVSCQRVCSLQPPLPALCTWSTSKPELSFLPFPFLFLFFPLLPLLILTQQKAPIKWSPPCTPVQTPVGVMRFLMKNGKCLLSTESCLYVFLLQMEKLRPKTKESSSIASMPCAPNLPTMWPSETIPWGHWEGLHGEQLTLTILEDPNCGLPGR